MDSFISEQFYRITLLFHFYSLNLSKPTDQLSKKLNKNILKI